MGSVGERAVRITLLGKPGCHLCDDAREVIEAVREELRSSGISTELEEVDILSDPELARLHAEEIPVVLLNGKRHAIWRVHATKLRAAIEKNAHIPRWLP